MEPSALADVSRTLSWLLRHGALESKLPMDAAGWAEVDAVCAALKIDAATLATVVQGNDKQRLQREGTRIRACQGHSRAGVPVTEEALEGSWAVDADAALLWHGTRLVHLPSIAATGLVPGDRTHVHLAPSVDSVVGKRSEVDVLLRVDAAALRSAGLAVYASPNGVRLVRTVPPGCITGLRAETARARREGPAQAAAHGWDLLSP